MLWSFHHCLHFKQPTLQLELPSLRFFIPSLRFELTSLHFKLWALYFRAKAFTYSIDLKNHLLIHQRLQKFTNLRFDYIQESPILRWYFLPTRIYRDFQTHSKATRLGSAQFAFPLQSESLASQTYWLLVNFVTQACHSQLLLLWCCTTYSTFSLWL